MVTTGKIPLRKPSMMDHATPTSKVSAFCQAVLANLIPHEFWGSADAQAHNEGIFYRNVDRFIQLRRFESFSLHEVSQGIKSSSMVWLGPWSTNAKLSKSDLDKRLEILLEFLYYVFDSLLIPLIRANFHVTESNIHRYRLFFFRHDVWKSLSEPALASLKFTMFEEVKLEQARKILDSRTIGFSQVRLLPKESGVRPIMNLRRRAIRKGYQDILGSSINSVLAPVYNILTFEKVKNYFLNGRWN
jgi:telomerase reverse transcriptase